MTCQSLVEEDGVILHQESCPPETDLEVNGVGVHLRVLRPSLHKESILQLLPEYHFVNSEREAGLAARHQSFAQVETLAIRRDQKMLLYVRYQLLIVLKPR